MRASLCLLLLQGCISLSESTTHVVHYEMQVQSGAPVAGARVVLEAQADGGTVNRAEGRTDERGICRLQLSYQISSKLTGYYGYKTGGLQEMRVTVEKDGLVPATFELSIKDFIIEGDEHHRSEAVRLWKYDARPFGFPQDLEAAVRPFASLMSRRGLFVPPNVRPFTRGDELEHAISGALGESRDVVLFISAAFLRDPTAVNLERIMSRTWPRGQRVVPVVLGLSDDEVQAACPALARRLYLSIRPFDPTQPLSDESLQPVIGAVARRAP